MWSKAGEYDHPGTSDSEVQVTNIQKNPNVV